MFLVWDKGKVSKMQHEIISEKTGPNIGEEYDEELQYAKISVKIYKADGIPKLDSGIMAQVKKTFSIEASEFLDPYVEVFLEGLKGTTSKKKSTMTPCWNEQITFTLKFPIGENPLVMQLRDDQVMANNVIGTTVIPMDKISNPDKGGFLPTFGPCYVYLSNAKSSNESDVSFRGRLLMSLTTEIITDPALSRPYVTVESIASLPEGICGQEENFLLFACIRDGTMIEKRIADKPLRFSLQIGHFPECFGDSKAYGNRGVTGIDSVKKPPWVNGFSVLDTAQSCNQSEHCSSFVKPTTINRKWYNLPISEKKECLWLISSWPDYRRRMYISNILDKTIKETDFCLHSLYALEENKYSKNGKTEERIKILKDLEGSIIYFLKLLNENWGFLSSKTQLDKERWQVYENKLEIIKEIAASYKNGKDEFIADVNLAKIEKLLQELKTIKDDPQPALPDVVVWMENNQRRIGYFKIAARSLLYAGREEEKGAHCGKIRSIILRPLFKKKNIHYLAKLDIYLWLGLQKHFSECLRGLPQGFDSDLDGREIEQIDYIPPVIHYYEKQFYDLHAHIYQARFLLWSEMSKFPSPVAQLSFSDKCLSTKICEETLNPIWDETLKFSNVIFYGNKSELTLHSPEVVIEIFNYNPRGKTTCLCRGIIPVTWNSSSPPVLKWYNINSFDSDERTEILAAFELLLIPEDRGDSEVFENKFYVGPKEPIPQSIRPRFTPHRIEVLFWGLRDLKRIRLTEIGAPKIELECGGTIIESSIITNYKKHSNFTKMIELIDVELPESACYFPALTVRLLDCKSFGRKTTLASHIVNQLQKYVVKPNGYSLLEPKFENTDAEEGNDSYVSHTIVDIDSPRKQSFFDPYIIQEVHIPWINLQILKIEDDDDSDDGGIDWWFRYCISSMKTFEHERHSVLDRRRSTAGRKSFGIPLLTTLDIHQFDRRKSSTIPNYLYRNKELENGITNETVNNLDARGFVIYPCELENVSDFGEFKEWLHSFELTRGRTFARFYRDEERTVAVFKGCFRIYEIPFPPFVVDPLLPMRSNSENLFSSLPDNKPTKVLVRVYVVEATDLTPSDITNTADPYISINLGNKRISDQANYVSKQLNPVFGRCFEFVANFPSETILHIQVMDWDLVGADDLIGETHIDLENRFYSRHRATCGLPRTYETSGPNAWRDVLSPSEILTNLCEDNGLGTPLITEKDVRIADILYHFNTNPQDDKISKENMALYLLHRWKDIAPGKYSLVPEHLETRTLYHPSKPGESQGKLVLWVDMFPENSLLLSVPRDISKRKPVGYELRVIIWNTDEVILADDAFLTGEKMSDIYVKGWLTGKEDSQKTDIHYRSLTGEGNFNWRFVFPFDYLKVEREMIVMKKVNVFSWDETEFKLPPVLKLQIYDADHFKADDFLGEIHLDLRHFPRGAKTVSSCNLNILEEDERVPRMSLFKQKRVRGWWPVTASTADGEKQLTGKIEAELHLLKKEEAEESPVGLGRKEPDALPPPKRPETSFANFLHPWKTFRYAFWKRYKRWAIKVLILAALILILVLFVYSTPGYIAKRLIGA